MLPGDVRGGSFVSLPVPIEEVEMSESDDEIKELTLVEDVPVFEHTKLAQSPQQAATDTSEAIPQRTVKCTVSAVASALICR